MELGEGAVTSHCPCVVIQVGPQARLRQVHQGGRTFQSSSYLDIFNVLPWLIDESNTQSTVNVLPSLSEPHIDTSASLVLLPLSEQTNNQSMVEQLLCLVPIDHLYNKAR
jgi:hypothetical protein